MSDESQRARQMHETLERAVLELGDRLLTPALVIDLDAVEHNIERILAAVGTARRWRPHIKTIKQSRLVRMLMARGVTALKCSTLDELALVLDTAERVHPEGAVDVLWAYPPTRADCRVLVELAREHEGGRIRLLADSPEHGDALANWLDEAKATRPFDVLLDVDVGMRRTGSPAATWAAGSSALAKARTLRLAGLHGYEGHVEWDQADVARAGYDRLTELARAWPVQSRPLLVTSGSHGFVHALAYPRLADSAWDHQVSMGTLVLSDLRSSPAHRALGLRQAAFVASRVVSRPGPDRVTLDAGSKAIAPDRPAPNCAVLGREDLVPASPSEEHLPCRVLGDAPPRYGDLLFLVPDHVCTTVNLHRHAIYVRGGSFVGRGAVEAMSRTTYVDDRRP